MKFLKTPTPLFFFPSFYKDDANVSYTPALADNCTFVVEVDETVALEDGAEASSSDDDDLNTMVFYNSTCEEAQVALPKAYASNLSDDKVVALVVTWGLGSLIVVLLWGRREYNSAPEQQDIRRVNTINRDRNDGRGGRSGSVASLHIDRGAFAGHGARENPMYEPGEQFRSLSNSAASGGGGGGSREQEEGIRMDNTGGPGKCCIAYALHPDHHHWGGGG